MPDRRFLRRWSLLVAAFLPFLALWALSNPLFASPDETTHMVRAQSIAAGQFSSPFVTDGLPIRSVECFAFQGESPASCQDLTWDAMGTEYELPTENYPPFFHIVASVPHLVTSGLWGAFTMRLWLATLCALLVGWAGALLSRPGDSPWLLTGFCIALTPMAAFTMATVNSTGLAVASTALVVAGLRNLIVRDERGREVIAAIGIGASSLLLVRRDGVIWLAMIAAVFSPLGITLLRGQQRWRLTRRATIAVLASALLAGYMATVFAGPTLAGFLTQRSSGGGTHPWEAARLIRAYLAQVIGTFGWLDTPIGEEAFLIAMIVAGFLIVLGVAADDRTQAQSATIALAAILLAPVAFGVIRFPYLQGRYLLPMWVVLIVMAASAASTNRLPHALTRRLTRLFLTAWLVLHVVGFTQNIRRYAVGRTGPWRSILSAEWQPPMMSLPVVFLLLMASTASIAVIVGRLLADVVGDHEKACASATDIREGPLVVDRADGAQSQTACSDASPAPQADQRST